MKRLLITGSGGSAATNFVRSLRLAPEKFYLVGVDANEYYLMRSETDVKYLVPRVDEKDFLTIINAIIAVEHIDFIHVQNDDEIRFFSKNRKKIHAKLFLPSEKTVTICQDKFLSYSVWSSASLQVPKTMRINSHTDLKKAFTDFGGKVWLRSITGAGGKGSIYAKDFDSAIQWMNFQDGYGKFTAAELLDSKSTTWMSLWHNGKLIAAQGRQRLFWELSKLSPSGVTGVTGAGMTVSDKKLDEIAIKAVTSIDSKPHGLFGVDVTYDMKGRLNITEINIGRFFTTHFFFSRLGLNMPYLYVKLAFNEPVGLLKTPINPLPKNMIWIRGVDFEPVLVEKKEIEKYKKQLSSMRKNSI